MKKMLGLLLAVALLLAACGAPDAEKTTMNDQTGTETSEPAEKPTEPVPAYIPTEKIEGNSLYVEKVEDLPADFILGMDASAVPAEEASGVVYYNFAGEAQDVYQTLAEAGINTIRVRVWNDPYDEEGRGFGGGNCDIDTAVEIGKRATKYGMKLLVDFHYSDFWADPGKQMCPRAWEGMTIEEKTEAAYQYTKECLKKLKDAGVNVAMVQVGNETNGALAGEKIWFNIQYIMQAGARATREIFPDALVAVHFANPENADNYISYAKKLAYYDVDYDVFGSSYYPYWHGTLENLAAVLNTISRDYGKKTMVLETSYAYTPDDTDFSGNTISEGSAVTKDYPYTVQGQVNSVRNVINCVANDMTDGIGVVYWEGTWISVGTNSWEENSLLWETCGSGWATSYAAVYDPNDAGKYYGGCAVDNQAFFDANGHPLESLQLFNLVRYGNEVPLKADAIEDVNLMIDLNDDIILPETVNAVMSDNSRQEVPVVWDLSDEMIDRMKSGGVEKYEIIGEADGMEAHAYVSMIEFNFLENYSFEDGTEEPWVVTDLAAADELYVEQKQTDSLTGSWHYHFWSAAQGSVGFTLEQTAKNLKSGSYKFSISIMGGDAGETDIYAYVKIDGEIIATAPMTITSYGNWDTGVITGIRYEEGQELTVGIYVKCQGAGNGAWGKIDDALLNSESAE